MSHLVRFVIMEGMHWWPINFVLSCRIAGTVGGAATCPLDVAKTRLQSSLIAAGHMQTRPTLNVAGDGLTATLHASLHRPQCGRTTVSIGFYHCIRWTSEVTVSTSAESTFWYLADTWWCCLALWQGLLQNISAVVFTWTECVKNIFSLCFSDTSCVLKVFVHCSKV